MSIEYAPLGFVGLLTPQANTAVEPECALLLAPGIVPLAARLTSPRPTIEERLVDYFETLDESARQFAGVPLGALGFACTGSSYLAGRDREDRRLEDLSGRLRCPVTSSARAVVDALAALGARRIALVSPYPAALTQHSIRYWTSRDLQVDTVAEVVDDGSTGGHPVYRLGSDAALRALAGLRGSFEAVVLLGTGLPTLRAIGAMPRIAGAPVISCTFALAWRCALALAGRPATADSLLAWIDDDGWRERYRQRTLPIHDGRLAVRRRSPAA